MAVAGDHVQVLVGGYELTGDSNKVVIQDKRKTMEATSFGMAAQRFIPGRREMKLEHSGFLNPSSAASHPVLNGLSVSGVVSVLLGSNTAPSTGDMVYNLLTQQELYQTKPEIGQVIPFSAKFANRGDMGGWGVLLAEPSSIQDTSTGSSVDNGAASSAGGAVFLHILQAASSDTYTISVQGSDTGAFSGEESTLASFTLDATQVASEQLALPTSIPRYLRYQAVRTGSAGDTVRLAVSVVRQS